MKKLIVAFLIFATLAVLPGCTQKYDTLVDADEECNRTWSNIDTNLQRRKDLIPNLVSVVKGIVKHEEKVFIGVAQARAGAGSCDSACAADPKRLAKFQEAQSKVKASMVSLVKLQESYPKLTSSDSFRRLQSQIEGTENRILRSRQEYNGTVGTYNKELRRVSGKMLIVVGIKEFKERPYYKADADAKNAPTVKF